MPTPIKKIRERRYVMQDPYAYIDGDGGYLALVEPNDDSSQPLNAHAIEFDVGDGTSGVTPHSTGKPPSADRHRAIHMAVPKWHPLEIRRTPHDNGDSRLSNDDIEGVARQLQAWLWRNRHVIHSTDQSLDPAALLAPEISFRALGYDFDFEESLGQYRNEGQLVEVAGLVNPEAKTVRISRRFPPSVQRFTAAHELGHALLHPGSSLHRDKPLDGSLVSRSRREREADRFAAYFLMPSRLVRTRFAGLFGTHCFLLSRDSLFALDPSKSEDLVGRLGEPRACATFLAATERHGTSQFRSLATQFGVTAAAMAIRIEELRLLGES